jgi:hypothetical protein
VIYENEGIKKRSLTERLCVKCRVGELRANTIECYLTRVKVFSGSVRQVYIPLPVLLVDYVA